MNKKIMLASVIAAIVVVGVVAVIIDTRNQTPQETSGGSSTTTSQVDTSDWKTYRNEELGFEFKYPSTLEEEFAVRRHSNDPTSERGEKGRRFIITFKGQGTNQMQSMNLSSVGDDYSAGRESYFGDTQGYSIDEQGNYYYLTIGSQMRIYPVDLVEAPIGKIVLVNNESFGSDVDFSFSPGPEPGGLAALVNFPSDFEFSGFAVTHEGLDEGVFIEVLKTINLIEKTIITASQVDTSEWKTYQDKKWGFEFKYPQILKVFDCSSNYVVDELYIRLVADKKGYDWCNVPAKGIGHFLYIESIPLNSPVVDRIEIINKAFEIKGEIKAAEKTISNKQTTVIDNQFFHTDDEGNILQPIKIGKRKEIIFQLGDKYFSMVVLYSSGDDESLLTVNENDYDRFIEQVVGGFQVL